MEWKWFTYQQVTDKSIEENNPNTTNIHHKFGVDFLHVSIVWSFCCSIEYYDLKKKQETEFQRAQNEDLFTQISTFLSIHKIGYINSFAYLHIKDFFVNNCDNLRAKHEIERKQ